MKLEPNTAQKPKSCPLFLSFVELHKSKCQTNIYFAIDAFEHSLNIDYQCILLALSFIKGYGQTAAPLTALVKKDSFSWNEEANLAFQHLKSAMSNQPVLALPNFDKPFMVEFDAFG